MIPANRIGNFPSLRQKKALSQVFISDYSAVSEIFDDLDLKGKTVLEIGSGTGAITKHLALKAKKVIGLEIDSEACKILRETFSGQKNVEILNVDALQASLNYPVIIGFLPYHISTPLLFRILNSDFEEAIVCVQLEFAKRMVAESGTSDFSKLSVMSQCRADITYLATVPKEAFSPIPKVDSALVYLEKNLKFHLNEELVSALFQHKNQSVKKALSHSKSLFGEKKETLAKFLSSIPTDLSSKRIRFLSLEDLDLLSSAYARFITSPK
ncbi:MAG: 16S rRNA (adenine(1518)-N(6)/adenine(1519)-N(6))-dimethyltransferase RsmA [Candidatus Micrarchaeota archaeon]